MHAFVRALLVVAILAAATFDLVGGAAPLRKEWNTLSSVQPRNAPHKAYLVVRCDLVTFDGPIPAIIGGHECNSNEIGEAVACLNTKQSFMCAMEAPYVWHLM